MRGKVLVAILGVILVVSGLVLSGLYDLGWLRVLSVAVGIAGAGIGVMVAKQRRQKRSRSDSPDSVESTRDTRVRAAAFIDGVVLTALAVLLGTLVPQLPTWVVCFGLLIAMAASYWLRWVISLRDPANADR